MTKPSSPTKTKTASFGAPTSRPTNRSKNLTGLLEEIVTESKHETRPAEQVELNVEIPELVA